MSTADGGSDPTFFFMRGPSRGTFVGRPADAEQTLIGPEYVETPEAAARMAQLLEASRTPPHYALTSTHLPEGILALVYRPSGRGHAGTILVSRHAFSRSIVHRAWIALVEDVSTHPVVDGPQDRVVALHQDNTVHFPEGRVLELNSLQNASGGPSGIALRGAEDETIAQQMLSAYDDAPMTVFHGFEVQMRREGLGGSGG